MIKVKNGWGRATIAKRCWWLHREGLIVAAVQHSGYEWLWRTVRGSTSSSSSGDAPSLDAAMAAVHKRLPRKSEA